MERDEICKRIEKLKSDYLIKVAVDETGWETLYQDPNDNRYWLLTYPNSEYHGGGPPTLKVITSIEAFEIFGID
ncbi:Imm27 family immunity protein [Algoriphagus boritolerans]|uniref:Imm27 family immunity protein n=1 Tax=Algoriphagus boritolerans TaxID=308111 RepID=UPI0021CEE4E3|nr:Imm27 family immunity protein [Algoriphagus boritolerans]